MSRPTDADLRAALARCLGEHTGRPVAVAALDRRPAPAASSFALEELDVTLVGGGLLRLVFKDFDPDALFGAGRAVRPAFLHDPRREIEVYRSVLDHHALGTAAFYGALCDPPAGRHWLFLERVEGKELYQVGDFDVWLEAARWLARFHARHVGEVETLARRAALMRYDADFYRVWPERARAFLRMRGYPADQLRRFDRLFTAYGQVVGHLTALPATLVHGDFYPANVLTRRGADGLRVCPIDWEQAGAGPGLLDLAALTAGKWSTDRRTQLALAYYHAAPSEARPPVEMFLRDLEYCRLHVAVQWLGWSADWSPPPEQTHDWFDEALETADRLGLGR